MILILIPKIACSLSATFTVCSTGQVPPRGSNPTGNSNIKQAYCVLFLHHDLDNLIVHLWRPAWQAHFVRLASLPVCLPSTYLCVSFSPPVSSPRKWNAPHIVTVSLPRRDKTRQITENPIHQKIPFIRKAGCGSPDKHSRKWSAYINTFPAGTVVPDCISLSLGPWWLLCKCVCELAVEGWLYLSHCKSHLHHVTQKAKSGNDCCYRKEPQAT